MESVIKRQFVETAATDGKCYLRLITAIKSFKTCTGKNLESALILLIRDLGDYPMSFQILGHLMIADWLMRDKTPNEIMEMTEEQRDSDCIRLLEEMMESSTRFGFTTTSNSTNHIVYYNSNAKFSEEVFNEDGYSAKFVISQLCDSEMRMGSAINFDDLFQENGFSPVTQENVNEYSNRNFAQDNLELMDDLSNQTTENQRLRREVEKMREEIRSNLTVNTVTNKNRAEKMLKINKWVENSRSPLTENTFGLNPNDSSSQADRYEKNFLDDGTILTINPREKAVQQISRMSIAPIERDFVVGYQKTNQMVQEETKINQSMKPINGLANPFKDSRLNFLCHFNSALEELKLEDPTITIYKMFNLLNDYKSETPSQELIYQMISKTFDLKRGIVIANPFTLPFIQVGMHISEASLTKTFDLLQTEYRMKWFDAMKNLRVPYFHSEYYQLTDLKLSRKIKSKSQNSNSNKKSRERERERTIHKSSGSSTLSFFAGRS